MDNVDNVYERLSDIFKELNDKLNIIYDISSILKKTNTDLLKTDENIKELLNRITDFESKFLERMQKIYSILEFQDTRIKKLESIYNYTSISKN